MKHTPAQKAILDAFSALPPVEAFAIRDDLEAVIRNAEHPRLTARIDRTDDGDEEVTFVHPDGREFGPGSIVAVDTAERWTYAEESIDSDDYDESGGSVSFHYDGSGDYYGLAYTLDGVEPIRLPEGWTER